MKNARNNGQKRVKNCLKWTASGLLLTLMFVLVFAGTLSGAFGIENELQQNGIIQSNVASAAGTTSVSGFSEYLFKFSDFNHDSESGTSMGQDRGIVHVKNSTRTTRSAIYSYVSLTGDILKHIQAGASVTATLSFYGDDSGNADKWGAGILSRQPKYGDVKTDSNYWADSTAAGFYNRSVINDNTGPKNTKSASVKLYDSQEQPTRITSFYVGLFVKADYAMDIGFHDIKLTFTYSYDYPVTFSATTGGTVSKATDNITGSNGNAEKKATSTASVATPGYHFVNWTKGNTSTEYSQNTTIEIGSSDFFEYDSYTANFALNRLNVVYWQNHTETDNTTWTDTFTYTQPKSFRNLPKNGDKTFVGWSTSRNGAVLHGYNTATDSGTQSIGNTSFLPAENDNAVVNLYAVWVDSDFGVLTGHTADETWGTINNPFVIKNAQHLINLSDIVNDRRDPVNSVDGKYFGENINTAASNIKFEGCYFVISADLGTADAKIELVPIGKDNTHYFAGTIFGGNDSDANNRTMRTISLNIQSGDVSNVGLFGYVKGATATISHLTTAGTIVGGAVVGGLVGYADGVTISNCRNNASISGKSFIGGIVGKATNATINASHNTNTIQGSSTNVGGILGGSDTTDNNILITSCYNIAKISGIDNVGGITGRFAKNGNQDVKISNCYNLGEIFGTADSIGGIVGFSENGCVVEYCYNKAKITGSYALGGIVGSIRNGGSISILYCYADFTDEQKRLNATNPNSASGGVAGGIVSGCFAGTNTANITVENSWAIYNRSSVKYTDCKKQFDCITDFAVAPLYFDGTNYVDKTWTDILTVNIKGFKISGATKDGEYLALHDGKGNAVLPYKMDGATDANSTTGTAHIATISQFSATYKAERGSDVIAELKSISSSISDIIYDGTLHSATGFTVPNGYNNVANFYFKSDNGNPIGYPTNNGRIDAGNYYVISEISFVVDNTTYIVGRKVVSNNWVISTRSITLKQTFFEYFYGAHVTAKAEYDNVANGHKVTMNTPNVNFYAGIPENPGYKNYVVTSTNVSVIIDGTGTDVSENYNIPEAKITVRIKEGDFGVFGTDDITNNPWGSAGNPYVIRTKKQLERLAQIVGDGIAVNCIRTADYPHVKAQPQSNGQSFANCYFKLASDTSDINMSYTSSFGYTDISSTPVGNNGEDATKLFDDRYVKDNYSKLCVSSSKSVTVYVSTTTSIVVNSYSWWTGNDTAGNTGRNPNYFKIEGSNDDGKTWHVIDERSNDKWTTENYKQVDVTGMNGAGRAGRYNKFRIYSTCSGGTWQANEFKFNYATSEQSVPIGVNVYNYNNSTTTINPFSGTFDGKNHTISNFKTSGQYSGLFGYVNGATIQNLTVNVTNNAGATSAGGLVGVVNGTTTIRNCTVNGTISGTHQVGGFVGFAQGVYQDNTLVLPCNLTIEGCTNNATVTTTSQYSSDNNRTSAGGFVGYVNAGATVTIKSYIDENGQTKKSTNNGEVKAESATANTGVGGFVGYSYGTINITDATNTAKISGSASSRVGGVVGYSATLTMNGATNSGQVSGASQVGGIAGYIANGRIYGTISNSGAITGTSMVGGIGGRIHTYFASDTNVYGTFKNTESVTGTGDSVGGVFGFSDKELHNASNTAYVKGGCSVGGIVGRCQASIQNSYNTGKVRATTSQTLSSSEASATPTGSFVGGIVGYTSGGAEILNCYNTGYITASLYDDADNQNNGYFGSADYVGGIVGYAQASVTYCANIGGIIDGNNFLGGIVGSSTSTVEYCYDIGGQRQYRWQSANLGGITGSGGTVTNSWVVNEQEVMARADTQTPNINAEGHKFTTELTLVPAVVSGDAQPYTYNVTANNAWTDILTTDINGFKVTASVQDGYYLSSTTTENGSAGVLPTIVESNAVANAVGQTRKNVTPLSLAYVYSATTGSNIYVATREIEQNDLSSVIYNGKSQGIAKPTMPSSFAINSFYFTHGNANDVGYESRTDVGTYDIITDISVTIGTTKYVVGRKVHQNTWTINKKTLTITPTWSANSESNSGNHYIYVYNAKQQGVTKFELSGFVDGESIDNLTTIELINNNVDYARTGNIYNLSAGYAVNANNYGVTIKVTSHNYTFETNPTSIETATEQKQYTWQIKKFDLSAQNVWFGGTTNLIVGNQGIANVEGDTTKSFYPLQADKKGAPGVQQVLVYAQHNYAVGNFVLYVKYNNGIVAELKQGTDKEYTVGTLDTSNNTVGTFDENVVSQTNPVQDTNVTASGKGNFSGNITKWYTALFSDFGWKAGKTPEDNDWGGSADNPYVISTPEHLLRLSQIVNGGMAWNSINTENKALCISSQGTAVATDRTYSGAYFLVTADINMTGNVSTDGVYNFLPIGHRNEQSQTDMPFSGTFDGNGKAITFVYNTENFGNDARVDYVGLFGYVNGATVTDLIAKSIQVNGIKGRNYVGGIVGYAENSHLVNVQKSYGDGVVGENYVGGVVGYAENTLISCNNDTIAECNVTGAEYVGGIVGKWIVTEQKQIGGSDDGQVRITPGGRNHIIGTKYVGGLFGWLDMSGCEQSMIFKPQFFNEGLPLSVTGTEYVGALFGVVVGNGYHQSATQGKYTAIVISDQKVNNITLQTNTSAKVVGGLVGYAESVGILFETDWNTSSTIFTLDDSTSFFGGVVGLLGKNSTIEAIIVTKEGDGSYLTGSEHTILNNTALGASGKPIGSFVGGIVGYVYSQAGTYWEANTTIFGNGISLVNSGQIHATGYAGGIFGALGDISESVAQTFENDTNSILYNVLTTGVRSGNASTTLGLAPTVSGNGITAQGRLVNNASISVSGSYVGGIAGYGGAKVRFVLRNTPQDSAIDVSKLNIYSGGSDIFINGSYAGGIAGYLVDNLEHDLQYIVVKARFNTNNQSATRVGGLVGYMGSGNVQNCVVTNGGSSAITASTDTYQGSEYVGGLVGETQNATIRNSVSTGFNLEKTSNTKGGLLGYGANPTIDSSWTFYIAKKRTNFAKNATPNGAYYATVSQSPYGKYILVDEGLINATEASYPTFVSLCGFVGLLTNANVEGTLEFDVKVPNKTLDSNYENTQLAFYNASGSDTVTDNVDSFSKFENNNNTLTIALDMASGNSMQICVVGIEFANIPQKNDTDTDKTTVVEGTYRKPSNSDKYIVHVTTANFNSERQITKIVATVYFECNDNLSVVIGSAYDDKRNIGGYDETFTPGSSTNPYTISSQKEWNDFAYSVYSGANNYSGKYVKLLTDSIVINTGNGGQHAGTKGTHNFGTETTNSGEGAYATDNVGYNFAGSISNSNLGGQSFQGYFDGNGHSIEIRYDGGNYHNVSVFPNANGATFKNLTITGSIKAGDKTTEWKKEWQNTFIGIGTYYAKMEYKAASNIAGFVGKPLGKIVFENCTNAANIVGYSKIAGFAGYSTSTAPVELTGCVNKGDIESFEGSTWTKVTGQDLGYPNDYAYGTGGLIAYAENAITIESCLNTGKIKGKTKVGGLVGRVLSVTTINNSANTGDIEADEVNLFVDSDKKKPANAWSRVGGIVGEASQSSTLNMYACYNTGHIRGWSNVAGGLVGMVGTIPNTEKTHSAVADNLCTIAYSYNTGKVEIGNIANQGITMVGSSGYNLNGTCGGGLVGVAVKLRIAYSYNTGDIIGYGGVGYSGSWQIRLGGILAEACTKQTNCDVRVTNCYSTGRIYIEENTEKSDTRYGADIVGYLDEESTLNNGNTQKVNVADCYGVANNIVSYENKNRKYFSGWNNQSGGDVKYVRTGTTLNSLSDLTAIMRSDGSVKPRAFYYANNQNNEVELWNASTSTIGAQNTTDYKNGTMDGYVYVYGCLPQLAVFAVDTYNGLSMNSQNFGKDIYGEYKAQKAGEKYSPYVIRDGIDLMGVQTLVGLGYTFDDKYIEFANGSNNITLDKNLSSDVAKAINMPISNSTSTKIADSENAYKSLGKDNTYHIGKSYHLFKLSAVCYDDNNIAQNTAYGYWLSSNHYYNGAYGNKEGAYKNYGTFKTQNILTIGRNGKVFKGSISGKQENNANTVINNLRITSGQTIGGAYAGLFGHIEDAYVGYIEVGGESNIWAYSSDNQQIAATGAIAGYVTGDSIIEHCAVSGTTAIGAYGKNDDTHIASDITYAGGIVGLADPKQGSEYKAGISAIIKDSTVNISTTTGDRAAFAGIIQACKSNIGGVLGYVGGDAGASGKGNSVRIEGCNVQKAAIQAASSATESSHIGGVLGYGSEYVAAFITGCKVGNGTDTVTIKGEHSLGGIAGGMSNAKGGYIDSCTVGANTTIERINQGGGTVSENPKHGTAIGGLVGFTEDSTDTISPLTTTFSGTSAFNGKINVTVGTTNPGEHGDKKPVGNVGSIVGDMGSGANFASGSEVEVRGNINVTLEAANVGGVAGRTNTATFIGKFEVRPTMNTSEAENVGGFIGKNVGTVYILADTTERIVGGKLNGTEIIIGGTIQGTSEVGGFIGVNNSGSSLNIGSNVANAKPYKSGTLSITITASVTGSGDNVGGIVGKNEGADGGASYASIDIVKGTITQRGTIQGANYVGGIIGLNDGLLTTGGGEADTSIGGTTLDENQIGLIKNLSITNNGNVTGSGNYVGGVVGKLDSPAEDSGKGAIAGTFTNSGTVVGNNFVGGSLGFVGKNVTITAKNNVATLFVNDGEVNATGYFVGGSIGALVGKIQGENSSVAVKFENKKKVNATGYVGGSIGVLAGPVSYAQFVNSSGDLEIAAVNSVGGSVGYIGVPSLLSYELIGFTAHKIDINNTHFEASGTLKANPSQDAINAAKEDKEDNGWGGVGGAIGVMGAAINSWTDNTYYANGNVSANVIENGIETGIYNVGGIVGLINAGNITISNMLAYRTTVTGGKNVGGIVGATTGAKTVINSAYAIEGTFSATSATKGAGDNVGGIIGLAKDDTDASTSYWVKGYANSDIATYDVKDLSKLGFTTGKATTGWFFLYANDATGANGLGTINTSHSTNSDLQYWKRIADAYTASERQTKIKDETGVEYTLATIPLKSDIVKDKDINGADTKSPQKSTLYATATAAEANSQYYMYTATSNEAVKPQVEFDDTRNGYFISVKTNDQDATGNKRQAQNVAVFYRKITKGSDLTYNGYARNAVVGMDGVGLLEQTPDETTVYDETYRNKYFYTTSTSVDGTTATTAMSDPNTYKSTIKIYFFDGKGKARIVGGIDDLEWTIKARELSATFIVATKRKYGEDSNGSEEGNKYDMFVSISNIAPNRGKQVPIKLDVSVGNDIVVTFTWNGSAFTPSKAGSGITLLSSGMKQSEAMKDSDTMFIAEEQTDDGLFTQLLNCYLVFTEAKAYTVKINTLYVVAKQRYTIKDGEDTGSFTVDPKELTLERTSGGSHAFDNTSTHGAEWKITGFVYEDGFKQLAQFNPVFHSNGQTENMYDSGGLKNNINFTNGSVVQATQTDGVNKTITITLSTVRTLGDYYIEFNAGKVGENKYIVGNYELSFVKGQNEYHIVKTTIKITSSTEKGGAYTSKVYNQKTASITVTFTASADGDPSFNGIMNFEDFLTRFFGVKDTSKFSKVEIPTSSSDIKKTVSWTFTTKADADNYVVALIEGKDHVAEEANCAHDPDKLPSYTYKIKQRPVTISVTQTGSGSYTYNTKHQGLDTVSVNQGSQGNEIGLLADDLIEIKISGSVSKPLKFKNEYSKSAGISTIDAGTYSVSFALSTATSYTQNRNYTLSVSSTSKTEWIINQYVVKVGNLNVGTDKVYDARAVVPTISIEGMSGDGKTFIYHNDTVTISYSITKVGGTSYSGNKLVNAGQYTISIGGTNSGSIKANRTGTSTDTSKNYTFGNTTQNATYTIAPRPIEIVWNIKSYVYNESKQMLQISGIKIEGNDILVAAQSVDRVKGLGNDTLTFSRSGGGINVGTNHTTNAVIASVSGKNDEVDSIVENYTIKAGATSGEFTITPFVVNISFNTSAGAILNKVYNANDVAPQNQIKDSYFTWSKISGTNLPSPNPFTITGKYDNKNVGTGKGVTFTYTFTDPSGKGNYKAGTLDTAQYNVGQITPAHIKVALDKLRSGKATRTFTNEPYYGGKDGASGGKNDGKSTVYRSGEGFRISGVFGNDDIKVVAKYAEAGDDRAMFDKYVNDIVKNADGTFAKAAAGTHLKMLVFEMTGGDATNYTFNVYDTSDKAYSKNNGDSQTPVNVYDKDDEKNNKDKLSQIKIEITVKTYKVEYTNAAQSYANADNTYNTNWERVGVSNNPPGVTVTVSNGWMYADGQDHGDDEQAEKKVYKAYTTIRGSQNSVLLGAKISGIDGMELNYKMVNQPILTIGYFVVDNNDVFEIGSASSLMIASYYWWVAQNGQNPDFNLPLVATSTWHKIVSNDDYMTKPFEKPSDAPNDVDMTGWDWDMYFAWFEQQNDVKIFLNETGISNEDGTWGYYTTGEESQQTQYKKYRMVRDFSGKLSESDIAILEAFFPKEKGWGVGKTYLDNFLNTSVGSVLTAVGSVFRWYNGSVGQFEFDGNGYVIEYLNIMGYDKENVGLFDIIGANGIVKNLHLRNITINANKGNVGGIAGSIAAAEGDADATKNVTNVSFHGKITATGGTVGGLFGTSARAINGAIVLGEISATNANVGGVVGTATADLTKVVSMMQITASGGTVGAFTSNNAHVGENCTHMTNAVWKKGTSGTGFVNVDGKNFGYNALMSGSNSLYANGASDSGTYDVISETFADSDQNVNPRQSKRLRDMVSAYLLMYSLSVNNGKYTISSSSWLVGTADGTDNNKIVIANKQNVSLLRELRFAAFVLKANVSIDIASTFSGAFYGSVTSAVNESGASYDYKITCNKPMFEAYATEPTAWLVTPTQP